MRAFPEKIDVVLGEEASNHDVRLHGQSSLCRTSTLTRQAACGGAWLRHMVCQSYAERFGGRSMSSLLKQGYPATPDVAIRHRSLVVRLVQDAAAFIRSVARSRDARARPSSTAAPP